MKKLIISPHVDDEVIGCGGILDKDSHVYYCGIDESKIPSGSGHRISIFVDRYGTYLYATDVATVTVALVKKQAKGLVHVAGNKKYSMYELAKKTTRDVKRVRLTRKNDYLTKDMSLTSIVLPSFPLDFSAGKKPIRL